MNLTVLICFFLSFQTQFGLCAQENCLKPSCIETTEIEELTQDSYRLSDAMSTLSKEQNNLSDNISEMSKKITDLTTENEKLKQQNDKQQVEIESLQLSVNELETLLVDLSKNVTIAWNDVTSITDEVSDLSDSLSELNVSVENLQLGYDELNSTFEAFEVKSSSLVEVFVTVIPPDVGTLKIPAEKCKWVQVFVDVESSAEHAVTYGLLYRDGYPIDGGKEAYSYTSTAATGLEEGSGGTTSRMYVIQDTFDSGVELYLGYKYWSDDGVHISMKALCFA